MLPTTDLRAIATARLDDARVLFAAGRYDWTLYTCGYAVECALKARITVTLNWPGFPEGGKEFEPFKSFKTHDLVTLLKLTGIEGQIRANHLADWSEVAQWNPEHRYRTAGTVSERDAREMVDSSGRLLTVL